MPKLTDIEAIGPVYARKLQAAGVRSANDLLELGATKAGRRQLAHSTGIPERSILRWVNHVGLMQVTGIGPRYADLLEEVGVDTSRELAQREVDQLVTQMARVNSKKKLVRKLPSQRQIRDAIAAAMEIQHTSHTLPGDGTTDAPPPK